NSPRLPCTTLFRSAVRAEVRDHVHIDFGMFGVDAVEHFLRQNAHLGPAHGAVVVFDLGAGDLGIFFRGPVGAVPVVGEGDGLGRAVVAALGAQAAGVAPHRDLKPLPSSNFEMLMAPAAQTWTHVPQPTHSAGSTSTRPRRRSGVYVSPKGKASVTGPFLRLSQRILRNSISALH